MMIPAALLALVSFVLHFAWESEHLTLYTGYEGISGPFPVTLYAALGDVVYTLGAYLVIALLLRSPDWPLGASRRSYALLVVLGLSIALFVEWKAALLSRWEYAEAMPTLFGIGFSPLVQMALLLPLSVYLSAELCLFLRKKG